MPSPEAAEVLTAAAFLWGYPTERWHRRLGPLARRFRRRAGMPGGEELASFAASAARRSPEELADAYVRAFDFTPQNALYLPAHEHADDRRRGQALLEIQERIAAAGLRVRDGELPDFYPLLLEFVAVAGASPVDPLESRLRALADRLADSLSRAESVYAPLARAVQCALPVPPARLGDPPREGGEDDRTMPYPLEYG
jgi:nitrate reductase delta subunit